MESFARNDLTLSEANWFSLKALCMNGLAGLNGLSGNSAMVREEKHKLAHGIELMRRDIFESHLANCHDLHVNGTYALVTLCMQGRRRNSGRRSSRLDTPRNLRSRRFEAMPEDHSCGKDSQPNASFGCEPPTRKDLTPALDFSSGPELKRKATAEETPTANKISEPQEPKELVVLDDLDYEGERMPKRRQKSSILPSIESGHEQNSGPLKVTEAPSALGSSCGNSGTFELCFHEEGSQADPFMVALAEICPGTGPEATGMPCFKQLQQVVEDEGFAHGCYTLSGDAGYGIKVSVRTERGLRAQLHSFGKGSATEWDAGGHSYCHYTIKRVPNMSKTVPDGSPAAVPVDPRTSAVGGLVSPVPVTRRAGATRSGEFVASLLLLL